MNGLTYNAHLVNAHSMMCLASDHMSTQDYDDTAAFFENFVEVFDYERVFTDTYVDNVFGQRRYAFIRPENNYTGDDLEARLYHDLVNDVYYLLHQPSRTPVDVATNLLTGAGLGVPDKFAQAAALMNLVRPAYRRRLVLTGMSLGGALAAYATLQAPYTVQARVFDPLGLNRAMLGVPGWGVFGQGEVLSKRFGYYDDLVTWYYIQGSWVANLNSMWHLSSLGTPVGLAQEPGREDSHDFRHIRYGLGRIEQMRYSHDS